MACLRFDGWEIDPSARQLRIAGKPARVGSRAFDLLLALARAQGRLLSKSALLDAAWPGLVVEENNLSVQITALRKLLGARAIVNVSGVGYQLASMPVAAAEASRHAAHTDRSVGGSLRSQALVGRDAELKALLPQVGACPLLSIVGTGGVGKTTLARALTEQVAASWPDGVHWIDLAAMQPGESLVVPVAQSLGVLVTEGLSGSDSIELALVQRRALVVLDNCEHLVAEVAKLLAPLLARGGTLRWLATSQEPLRLAEETVHRLGPLKVPPADATEEEALSYGAVALLCQRVRAADRRFELGGDRTRQAIDLCRQLDGLPLALEMAAARVAALGLAGVQSQIGERLRLRAGRRDVPPRQTTLRQTYEWSCNLLSPLERTVFRRLEPFAGGFTPQLASQACTHGLGSLAPVEAWSALEALSALVEKSLVQRESGHPGGEDRLYLLESARDFARLDLADHGELADARRVHAQVVATAVAGSGADLDRLRDADWLARYLPERRNVSVALAWAITARDPTLIATLAATLAQLDALTHTHAEVLGHAIKPEALDGAPSPLRARACVELAWAHFLDGDREQGTRFALRALGDFADLDDVAGQYLTLMRLFRLYDGRPGMQDHAAEVFARIDALDPGRVPARWWVACQSTIGVRLDASDPVGTLRELERRATQAGLDAAAAVCRLRVTDEMLLAGKPAEAAEAAREMLAAGEPLPRIRAVLHYNLAQALLALGRFDDALSAAGEVARALPAYSHFLMSLAAHVAARRGRVEDAALLEGAATRIRSERRSQAEGSEAGMIDATRRQLVDSLGEALSRERLAQGAAMPLDDVMRLAAQA